MSPKQNKFAKRERWMGPNVPQETEPKRRYENQMQAHRRHHHADHAPIGTPALANKLLVPQVCRCERPYSFTDEDGERRCLTCAKVIRG